ncbi:MAG: c-type cytochrome, partial [Magnetovibrio sp.]|nr:c-type cytochrome [Magnetovibrio sp.]
MLSPGEAPAIEHGCFGCHGIGGINENPNYPNLAGQKERYLVNQLTTFKRGAKSDPKVAWIARRYNGMMNAKAAQLSDQAIPSLARYFSARSCSFGPRRPQPPSAPAKTKICEQCHGKDGISLNPDTPNLAGQKQPY